MSGRSSGSPTHNGGTRASGTPGYDASAKYVASTLKKAGYKVKVQEFTFPFFRDLEPGVSAQISPTPKDYETATLEYSGSGDVTGAIVPTNDIVIPPTPAPSSTSGCEAIGLRGGAGRTGHRLDPARDVHPRDQGRPTRRPPAMTRCCSSTRANRGGPRCRPSPSARRPTFR